jgi:hypothetical protein
VVTGGRRHDIKDAGDEADVGGGITHGYSVRMGRALVYSENS